MNEDVFPEKSLIKQAQNGDADAMKRLIMRHYPLISSLAYRVYGNTERDSLIQSGMVGLIQAVKHYQETKEAKLITYAVPWILGEMKKALRLEIMPSADFSLEEKHGQREEQLLGRVRGNAEISLWKVDLHIAFEKLSGEERQILLLRYYRGNTQKETAAIMKKSQAQISRMENRVLDVLRSMLA